MLQSEKTIVEALERHKVKIFLGVITLLGIFIRLPGIDFISGDAKVYLLPWFETIKEKGGILALQSQVGDYNIPYQTLVALMTYIPAKPLYLYKGLSIIFDFLLASITAQFASINSKNKKYTWSIVYALVLVMPTIFMNSSIWGQCDSIYVTFILIALYYLYQKRDFFAFVFLGIAFAFKLQTVFILPFFIYSYVLQKRYSIFNFGIIFLVTYILSIPAFLCGRKLLDPVMIYFSQMDSYKSMWLNYPSFWTLVGNNYDILKRIAIVLTIAVLGTGLLWAMHKRQCFDTDEEFLKIASWTVWTCLLFLPSMHERYGYLLDVLLIILTFKNKKYFSFTTVTVLSSIMTYGNYFFANGSNVKLISIILTISYVCYSYVIMGGGGRSIVSNQVESPKQGSKMAASGISKDTIH